MIEENPFLQVGSLRNRNSNTLPKRSKERKKVMDSLLKKSAAL